MIQIFGGMGALFLTLLIALAFKFYAAFSTIEAPIARDYYEVGSAFDLHLAQTKDTANRALTSPFFEGKGRIGRGEQEITVLYTEAGLGHKPVVNADVLLLLSRRATTTQDSRTSCSTDAKGTCSIRVSFPGRGRWEATLTAKDTGGHRRIVKTFVVEG